MCACSPPQVPPAAPAEAHPHPPDASPGAPAFGDLEERVEALIPATERWQRHLTPVLPCSWPPTDGCVQFLVYESSALPTGTVQFRYRGPVSIARCLLPRAACSLAPVDGQQDEFVEMQRNSEDEPQPEAQQTLIDLVQGTVVPERAPDGLSSYASWLEGHSDLAASARSRVPEFSAWLLASRAHEPSGAP